LFGADADRAAEDIEAFAPPTGTVAVAQDEAAVRLQPSTQQVNIGDVIAVEVRIDNAVNLVAASIQLQFNPAILQVQDADTGREGVQIQPGNFPAPDFVAINVVTNTTGIINYWVTEIPPFELANESGLLATITFQAIAPGSSDLTFTEVVLSNNVPQPIPVTTQPGQITVGQGPTSTPTNTPLPGQATATFTPLPLPDTPTLTPIVVTATPSPTPTSTPTVTPPPTSTATPTNTPVPAAVEIPPGATVGFCYRVQPGENLFSLGQKFGIDPQFISLANDLYPPGHVYPQKILFIPSQYGTGPNVYLVQPGDTLALIAEQCGLPQDFVAAVNGLAMEANLANIPTLIIPRPPYAPPARYPYGPPHVWPPPCPPGCY
jgi:LysM repeat protein